MSKNYISRDETQESNRQDMADKKKINKKRLLCAALYLLAGVVIIYSRRDTLFYQNPSPVSYNFDRYIWCLGSSFIGFSVLAYQLRHIEQTPFPEYFTYYPVVLAVISALIFSACHLFQQTSGFVFYYLSSSGCIILSFLVDSFFSLLTSLVVRKGSS